MATGKASKMPLSRPVTSAPPQISIPATAVPSTGHRVFFWTAWVRGRRIGLAEVTTVHDVRELEATIELRTVRPLSTFVSRGGTLGLSIEDEHAANRILNNCDRWSLVSHDEAERVCRYADQDREDEQRSGWFVSGSSVDSPSATLAFDPSSLADARTAVLRSVRGVKGNRHFGRSSFMRMEEYVQSRGVRLRPFSRPLTSFRTPGHSRIMYRTASSYGLMSTRSLIST